MGEVSNKNKSSIFILPMLVGIDYKHFNGFLNCYIGCNYDQGNERRVYLLFYSSDLKSESEEGLVNNEYYVDQLIIDDFTVVIFNIPKEFHFDFDMFKEGKYTKFTPEYKGILKKMYPKVSKLHSIIEPNEKDRQFLFEKIGAILSNDCEIYDVIQEIEETFSMSHFIKVEV